MKSNLSIFFLFSLLKAQLIVPADPFGLINYEYNSYYNKIIPNTLFRPIINKSFNKWSIKIRNEIFYNNFAPNLENMGNRFIGKGLGYFSGINFSFLGEHLSFSFEPFYFINENRKIESLNRQGMFINLNDERNILASPYKNYGIRELQIYFSYNEYGLSISNANMWWGPGIHSSLAMTNNTSGFPYLMIGTLNEKMYGNIGYDIRYILSKLNQTNNNPIFSAIIAKLTFYNNPILTIGFNRNILFINKYYRNVDIAFKVFSSLNKFENLHQILTSYFILDFPKSRLRVFFEIGTTDRWEDFIDFLNYPDHGIGSIFGFRQYGVFNSENLIMGFEYARLVQSSFWEKRLTSNWYDNPLFDYSSYNGRRWAAHSGSDSDDLYIFFGFQNSKWSLIPAVNFERHGILFTRPAEVKMEIRVDFRYKWKTYWFNLFFEREWLEHPGFNTNKWRKSNVIWLGIERDLTNIFTSKVGLANY